MRRVLAVRGASAPCKGGNDQFLENKFRLFSENYISAFQKWLCPPSQKTTLTSLAYNMLRALSQLPRLVARKVREVRGSATLFVGGEDELPKN